MIETITMDMAISLLKYRVFSLQYCPPDYGSDQDNGKNTAHIEQSHCHLGTSAIDPTSSAVVSDHYYVVSACDKSARPNAYIPASPLSLLVSGIPVQNHPCTLIDTPIKIWEPQWTPCSSTPPQAPAPRYVVILPQIIRQVHIPTSPNSPYGRVPACRRQRRLIATVTTLPSPVQPRARPAFSILNGQKTACTTPATVIATGAKRMHSRIPSGGTHARSMRTHTATNPASSQSGCTSRTKWGIISTLTTTCPSRWWRRVRQLRSGATREWLARHRRASTAWVCITSLWEVQVLRVLLL